MHVHDGLAQPTSIRLKPVIAPLLFDMQEEEFWSRVQQCVFVSATP
jgi:hypothetical protein